MARVVGYRPTGTAHVVLAEPADGAVAAGDLNGTRTLCGRTVDAGTWFERDGLLADCGHCRIQAGLLRSWPWEFRPCFALDRHAHPRERRPPIGPGPDAPVE